MNIKNEIQHTAALKRYLYLDAIDSEELSDKEFSEWAKLFDDIYKYEEKYHPMGDISVVKSDTC